MNTNQFMKENKELLLSLFCETYPSVSYDEFCRIYDSIIFLMPNINSNDCEFLFSNEFKKYNQLFQYPITMILDTFGCFLPMYYLEQGELQIKRLVVCNMNTKNDLYNNRLLLHELKHALLYQVTGSCKRDEYIYVTEKSGFSIRNISIDTKEKKMKIISSKYKMVCEAFTDMDAMILAQKLMETGYPLFSGSKESWTQNKGYYYQLFPMIEPLFEHYSSELHEIEASNSSYFSFEYFPLEFLEKLEYVLDNCLESSESEKAEIGEIVYQEFQTFQKQKKK